MATGQSFEKEILSCVNLDFPDKPQCCEECHKMSHMKAFTFHNPKFTYKLCCNVAMWFFVNKLSKRLQ